MSDTREPGAGDVMKGKRREWAAVRLLRSQARVGEGTAAFGIGSLKAGNRFCSMRDLSFLDQVES